MSYKPSWENSDHFAKPCANLSNSFKEQLGQRNKPTSICRDVDTLV